MLLVGVSFIALGVNSGLYQQLHHAAQPYSPGPLTTPGALTLTFNLTRTALIVIGLLLLMLCHGLFRRKHRSWQAVMTLLILAAGLNVIRVRHLINMFGVPAMCIGFAITAVLVGLGFLLPPGVLRARRPAVPDGGHSWVFVWTLGGRPGYRPVLYRGAGSDQALHGS